ncbi:Fungalysin metallopeptidase-domain-containing protein [Syncephalis plumigaleata]|nr:Fungalysin metallopeptidase-domain-containing protein [Syncephalis plumigaleata]
MIWAQMLYEMYWQLVDNHDGIKLQPCRPSLLMARDAILLAEQLRTNGQYRCAIWTAFAKRGLGVDAKPVVTNATTSFASNALPPDCQVN